jgi:hypothetical protein
MRKRFKRIAFLTAVTVVGAASLQLISHVVAPGHFELISSAEAIVGRPLTPMSVAGVARRTAYRSAVYGHPYPGAVPYPAYHY